ncbi:MAG: bifunctional diaminohydroxyphosphoribosylaminopyrimidine deaminase/5-amino-6-(5-phosphoribosylamino)uracil reductase RibD [Pseudomonadota bacterium]
MSAPIDYSEDSRWMAAALRLARRGAGRTWPNPAVGAIIVAGAGAGARVVGRAVTATGGRPHAERIALRQAGDAARGATCYVTLEPCSHYGKTPPCVNALLDAGISRLVSAITDPDPRVAGRGYRILRENGVAVVNGILSDAAQWHHRGHFMRITRGRPHTVLKLAISSDGGIGRQGAGQVPITGAEVKRDVHLVRAETDAIMVGVGTVLADDPQLTCRIEGLEDRSPVRVVLDTQARTPLDSKLVRTAQTTPTWILASDRADDSKVEALRMSGVRVFVVPFDETERLCLHTALSVLGEQGITTVLIEGGAKLAESLIRSNLADLVDFYHATHVIGDGRIPALNTLPLECVTASDRYVRIGDRMIGHDKLHQYKRVA